MNIPMNADVYCQNMVCGYTQAVILNPVSEVVTHVVVKESKTPHTQRLVPIDLIDASLADKILLKCNEAMLKDLPPFFDVEYIQTTIPHFMHVYDMSYLEPIVVPVEKIIEEKIYHIPKSDLAVNRGTTVYSADGYAIGKVDEFLVDPNGGQVTHLILREGHILGLRDVFIPVAEIDEIKENSLRLKLDKFIVEKLPTIPVKRMWL